MSLAIGLILITHLVFPVAGLVWLWRSNELSKLEWLLKLSIILLYGIQIFLIGRWDFLSYFLRFAVLALLVVAVSISLIKAKSLPFYQGASTGWGRVHLAFGRMEVAKKKDEPFGSPPKKQIYFHDSAGPRSYG